MSAASEDSKNATTETFLTALAINGAILAVEVIVFVLLKDRLSRIYSPRSYLPPPDKRAIPLPSGPWRWIIALLASPPEDVIRTNGLDAYLFLRFLKLMIHIFGVFSLTATPILMCVDSIGFPARGTAEALDQFTLGNIPKDNDTRIAAHIVVVYILTG
ncbi:hypothetical protein BT69DRAFT_136456, partial [Atractiella rhizophila]